MVAGATMATVSQPVITNGGCAATSPTPTSSSVATVNTEAAPVRTRASENRRSNKPIMEKRRRARINNCLNELKTLILDAMKKDPARHSKLEKADILEMTVKHLENLQRQQVAMAAASDPGVANKFRAGFTECAGEVGRFPGLEGAVKRRLLQHLANCLNTVENTRNGNTETTTNSSVQVHVVRTQPPEQPAANQTSNIIFTANGNGQGLQLVPTRLPNGDIALILPSSNSFRTARATVQTTPSTSPSPSISSTSSGSSPLPMLIPIPNNSNSPSPVAFDRLSVNPTRQITIVTQNPQRIIIPAKEPTKNVPLLTTVQQVVYPEPKEMRKEEPTETRNLQPQVIRIKESFDDYRNIKEERHQPVVEHSQNFYNSYEPDRETLIHIPEREYYDRYSPVQDSPINYVQNYDNEPYNKRYADYEYQSDHNPRSYSPDIQKPLALVTKKKYEQIEEDERPWRPW